MPYVVTQACCNDASCVFACPVNCIHPTPDEPGFATAEMLHIDPSTCVDCGACVTACPVGAITPLSLLGPVQLPFVQVNSEFYEDPQPPRPIMAPVTPAPAVARRPEPLRVAVVGSGPAAMYAADELLVQAGVQVNVFDRLPTPYGLVRAGVAPDHQGTKQVTGLFDEMTRRAGFRFHLNVEVGTHVSHDELLDHHHAVIYAVGANRDNRLDIPGADLPGATSATDFVAWYNGHPDFAHRDVDLGTRRAVIVGNGNVALDVARILTADPERLAGTDIAEPALRALRASTVEEVVVVARRGLAQSAFTVPEFLGLLASPDIEVVLDAPAGAVDAATEERRREGTLDRTTARKLALLAGLRSVSEPPQGGRRIVLRYLSSPTRIEGSDRVTGVELTAMEFGEDGGARVHPTDRVERLAAGLVLTSIGYRGEPVAGLPFDDQRGVVPNDGGRVSDTPGSYVAGWIKRGPSGFIGTNKSCSQQTVRAVVADYNAGTLTDPRRSAADLVDLVARRRPAAVDRAGWAAIDQAERERGAAQHRVRDKFVDVDAMVAAASGGQQRSRRRLRV